MPEVKQCDLVELISLAQQLVKEKDFDFLREILASVPVTKTTTTPMIALFRAVSPARREIPGWTVIVDGKKADLRRINEDADALMRGL